MSDTVDIGAARVRLIVDAADFQPVIEQGKNAIRAFGSEAQGAYDRTEKGTRRAADALLDYVSSLGRADTTMDRFIRNASRMGVEKPVLDAAILAWAKHNDEVEQAAIAQADNESAIKRAQAAYKELMATQVQAGIAADKLANSNAAQRIAASAAQRASNAQQDFNALVAPGLNATAPGQQQSRKADAEAAFLPIIEAENEALKEQESIQEALASHRQNIAQQDFNKLLGIPEQQHALALAQKRRDAEAAFLPIIEAEAEAEAKANAQRASGDAFIKQLNNLQQAAGKGYYELLQLKAAELGISQAADPLIAKLKATNQAMGAGTISAKQYEFAVRGLPAQFTDVFVSLAAGQNPLTVLLQQGGQIKDMFGGIKTAVGAVASEIGKLATNPWIVLAAVIAAVAAAAYSASQRMADLAIATAKGDLVAGSAKELSALAEKLNGLNNINLSSADSAVASLASQGLLVGRNLAIAAEASARWATITGQSADDVTQKFNQVARDPLAAILDGTLKVTDAQYLQIAALEQTGDKAKATALAVQLFANQVNTNSASVLDNLSAWTKGFEKLKDSVTTAWHAFNVDWKGASSFAMFGDSANAQAARAKAAAPPASVNAATAPFPGVDSPAVISTRLTRDQVDANAKLQKSWEDLGTKAQIYAQKVKELNGVLKNASPAALAAKNITANGDGTFGGPGYDKLLQGERLKVFGQNPGGDPTRPIKEWEKTNLDAIKSVQQAQDFLYGDHSISVEAYYSKTEDLAKQAEQIELESITKQIAALKGRANSEAQIAQLQQERRTVEVTYANTKAKLDHDELEAIKARTIAYHDYVQGLADANIQLSRQGDQAARGVGMGSRQSALANAQDNARYDDQKRQRDIQDKADNGTITQDVADKDKEASAAALAAQLDILQGNYNSLAAAEADWTKGSVKAWQDWSTSVSNYAQEAGKIFTTVMDGIADSITQAAITGKLSFTSLLTSLEKEIIEFGAKQALKSAFEGILGGLGGSGGGSALGSLLGAFGGGGGAAAGGVAAAGSTLGDSAALAGVFGGMFAKGDTFGGGSGLSAYRNSVVSQPTYFPFAKGGVPNVGLMGEKSGSGGEAIMPLTRTSGGELAVKTMGSQQSRTVNVSQTFVVPGAANRSTQDQIAIKTYGAAQKAARRA